MFSSKPLQSPVFTIPGQSSYGLSNTLVQSEIKTFAAKADNLADQILAQNEPKAYSGPVIIHDHHYYQPWPMFWYDLGPRYVVINPPRSPEERRREDQNAAAVVVGIVATIVAGVTLYSLGSSIAAYNDATEELSDTYDFQAKLNNTSRNASQNELEKMETAYQVANLKGRICSRIKNSSITDMILKSSLAGSAGVALAGAFTIATAPGLMTAGILAGLASTGGLLFKWGFDSTDKINQRDAAALKASVSHLNSL